MAVFGVVIFFWFSFHQNGLTLTMFAKDYTNLSMTLPIIGNINLSVEDFQAVNPFIVVFLTPVIMWIFAALAKRGKEPSTPMKIGIGMGMAALAFFVMCLGSLVLLTLHEVTALCTLATAMRLTPWFLFPTYFYLHQKGI